LNLPRRGHADVPGGGQRDYFVIAVNDGRRVSGHPGLPAGLDGDRLDRWT
jgi:hypothetical protein